MNFKYWVFLYIFAAGAFFSDLDAQDDQVVLHLDTPTDTRLAVADFYPRSVATPETTQALLEFNEVLWEDLKFAGYFDLPSKSFYPENQTRLPQEVDFEAWSEEFLDIDYMAFGNLQVYESGAVVEAFVYDVKTREQLLGRRYTVSEASSIRRVVHQVSDQIVFLLSSGGSKGVSQTQIAFSSLKGSSKEVYVMDYDGANIRTITANGGINKFADWSRDNSKLLFVTKLDRRNFWELWIQDLAGGRTVVPTVSSYVSSPELGPEGEQVLYSGRGRGKIDPDIFISDPLGKRRRNLTNHPGIDSSPAWSLTGQQIAFISDRTGTPQVWLMDSDGSNLRRVVKSGGHCDSPEWSPDGRLLAFSWQAPRQWKHDIFVVEVSTGSIRQVTTGWGSNEHPNWAPDGRHLTFQSDRTGSKQIFITNITGENLKQITAYGINESPSWSSYVVAQDRE